MGEVRAKGKHIGMISKLISKLGFKPTPVGKTWDEFGFEVIWEILINVHKAEKELYELIASLGNLNVSEVPEMDIDEMFDVLKEVYQRVLERFHKPTIKK